MSEGWHDYEFERPRDKEALLLFERDNPPQRFTARVCDFNPYFNIAGLRWALTGIAKARAALSNHAPKG